MLDYYRLNVDDLMQILSSDFLNITNECRMIVNNELVRREIEDERKIELEICTRRRIPRDTIIACFGWHGKEPSSAIEAFDVTTAKWRRISSMHISRKVAYHATVVIDQKIYIAGGYDGEIFFNDFYCYDGEKEQWLELAPMHHARISTELRDMHWARSDAAACSMNGRIYVAGGFNGELVLQSVEMYIPDSDFWIEIATMNTPRSGLGCVVDGDSIVLAGGFDGLMRLSSVERLRSCSSYTMMLPSMPSARSNFGMCKYGGMIYVVGGYAKGVTSSVLQFDGSTWSESPELNIARSATKVYSLFVPFHILFFPFSS
ncbi:unnamed protein product [Toxocara canis]|uniref:BACK domain-containing protein n=1 Tax=Toxocara canis TaxID=6265 RepID=A0A183V078_TOXCA|nr:unnamed protein product [Toxocara canis]